MFLPSLCPISEFQTDAVYEISALVCKAITFLKFETNKVMQIGIMQELILVRVLTFRKPWFFCFTEMDYNRILTTLSDFIPLAIMHIMYKRVSEPPFLIIVCIISIDNTSIQYLIQSILIGKRTFVWIFCHPFDKSFCCIILAPIVKI